MGGGAGIVHLLHSGNGGIHVGGLCGRASDAEALPGRNYSVDGVGFYVMFSAEIFHAVFERQCHLRSCGLVSASGQLHSGNRVVSV